MGTEDKEKHLNAWKYNNYADFTGVYYTVKKIWKEDPTATTLKMEDRYRVVVDKGINWKANNATDPDGDGVSNTGYVQIIKFSPATTGNYEFAAECSGRGECIEETGLCDCFFGWEGDDCTVYNALAF